ncbi:unnamed protein product [Arctogadus glacialis]
MATAVIPKAWFTDAEPVTSLFARSDFCDVPTPPPHRSIVSLSTDHQSGAGEINSGHSAGRGLIKQQPKHSASSRRRARYTLQPAPASRDRNGPLAATVTSVAMITGCGRRCR